MRLMKAGLGPSHSWVYGMKPSKLTIAGISFSVMAARFLRFVSLCSVILSNDQPPKPGSFWEGTGQFTNNFLFSVRWFPLDGLCQFDSLLYLILGSPENKPYSPFRTADTPCTGLKGGCPGQYFDSLQLGDNFTGE